MPTVICDFKPNSYPLEESIYHLGNPENILVEQKVKKTEIIEGEDLYYNCTWTTIKELTLTCTYFPDGTLLNTKEGSIFVLEENTKIVRKETKSALEPRNPEFLDENCDITSSKNIYVTLPPFCDCPPPSIPRRQLRRSRRHKDPRLRSFNYKKYF
jgi:hypothetical protein